MSGSKTCSSTTEKRGLQWRKFYLLGMLILILNVCLTIGNEDNDAFLYKELQGVFEKAILEQPSGTGTYLQLADLHKENREYEKAISTLKQALNNLPTTAKDVEVRRIHYNLGVIQQLKGDFHSAIGSYEEAISHDPNHVNSFYNSGLAFQEIGDQEAAMEAFSYALRIDPNHTDSRINICNILSAKSHFALAQRCYEDVIKIDPHNVNVYIGLGGLYHMLNDLEKSRQMYAHAISLDNSNVLAKFALKALGHDGQAREDDENLSHGYVEILFDAYAKNFDVSLMKNLEYKAPQLISRQLLSSPNRPLKILDLGAGTGLLCEALRELDDKGSIEYISGVDISRKMVMKAETKNCYNDLHVSELKQFLLREIENQETKLESSVPYNIYAAADVFVYIGDFWDIIDLCIQQIKRSNERDGNFGQGMVIFTVEAYLDSVDGSDHATWDSDIHGKKKLYKLSTSGRYIHTKRYLIENLAKSNLSSKEYKISDVILRKNQGTDVHGFLVSIQIGSASSN